VFQWYGNLLDVPQVRTVSAQRSFTHVIATVFISGGDLNVTACAVKQQLKTLYKY